MQSFITVSLKRLRREECRHEFNYIVIEREFASGGRDIGKLVADKLNIPCYGREILEKAAERENLSVEYVEELEEGSTGSFLYSLYKISSMADGTMGGQAKLGKT